MAHQKLKTIRLFKSDPYKLSKQAIGTGLERFILNHAKKDPFLFTIENKSWEFFIFLTKNDEKFKFIEGILQRENLKRCLSIVSRINVNNRFGYFYQLLDKDYFLKTYYSTMLLYKSKYRFDIERYRFVLRKDNRLFRNLYMEMPIDLYKGYLEGVFSKL